MTAPEIIALLRARRSPDDIAGQRRFGITPRGEQLGVRSVLLRQLAREHRREHALALELWASDIYDARQLAALVDDPKQMTEAQMETWTAEFDNWATVDACCMHLFRKTPWAFAKAREWSGRSEEFVRRAGFTLMATLAVHAKKEPETTFLALLPLIEAGAGDERNFVKKAVNWALRQIGKRSATLRPAAMATAEVILLQDTPAARWVARGALRELRTYVR